MDDGLLTGAAVDRIAEDSFSAVVIDIDPGPGEQVTCVCDRSAGFTTSGETQPGQALSNFSERVGKRADRLPTFS